MSFNKLDPFSFYELVAVLAAVCPHTGVFNGHKNVSPYDVVQVEVTTCAGNELWKLHTVGGVYSFHSA